ncbi:MAG: glycosyltransferase [Paramuribaculum sp.]|nr:glycosyltransferase [Paramuribaculum sp.]
MTSISTKLDIAIATYGPDGIQRVASCSLPRVQGVKYVVSWQQHEDAPIPDELLRDDVEIYRFDGVGQSINRNNAFSHCTSEWVMVGDDDLVFRPDGLVEFMDCLGRSQDVDFATFRSQRENTITYPKAETDLSWPLPKGYAVCGFELAFRRSTGLQCCPEFGLNSPKMHGAEDEALLLTALRRGLRARFYPITITEHDHPSTGTKSSYTASNLRASGCFIALGWPKSALLRIPLRAWRVARRGQAPFLKALYYLSRGALAAPGVLRRNRKYLW